MYRKYSRSLYPIPTNAEILSLCPLAPRPLPPGKFLAPALLALELDSSSLNQGDTNFLKLFCQERGQIQCFGYSTSLGSRCHVRLEDMVQIQLASAHASASHANKMVSLHLSLPTVHLSTSKQMDF